MVKSKSNNPVGSVGWYMDIGVKMPTSAGIDMLNRMEQFEESHGGIRYLCEEYLNEVSARLGELGLSFIEMQKEHDIHAFLRIDEGKYKGKLLHLQAYPGMSSHSLKDMHIYVSLYVKDNAHHNAPNIANMGEKRLSWNDGYKEILDSIHNGLELN